MPSEGARKQTKYAPVQSTNTQWMLKAACRGIPMVDGYSIFFPKIIHSPGRPPLARKDHHDAPLAESYAEAIEICSRCTVIRECQIEFSRDPIPRGGMYFGKTPVQRARMKHGHAE